MEANLLRLLKCKKPPELLAAIRVIQSQWVKDPLAKRVPPLVRARLMQEATALTDTSLAVQDLFNGVAAVALIGLSGPLEGEEGRAARRFVDAIVATLILAGTENMLTQADFESLDAELRVFNTEFVEEPQKKMEDAAYAEVMRPGAPLQ